MSIFRNFRLKLSTTILLWITLPLVIETMLFAALTREFSVLQDGLVKEARYTDAHAQVNLILNDAMTVGGSLLYWKNVHDPNHLRIAKVAFMHLHQNVDEFKEVSSGLDSTQLREFVGLINEVENAFSLGECKELEDRPEVGTMQMVMAIQNFAERIRTSATKLMAEQMFERKAIRAKQQETRQHIRELLDLSTAVNLALAAVFAVSFSLTVGRKLAKLETTTSNLSMGKPLDKPQKGKDELARIDQTLYRMARDLAKVRRQERAMIDNTAEVIFSVDKNLRVVEVNSAIDKRFLIDEEDFRGSMLQAFVHKDDQKTLSAAFEKAVNSGRPQEFEVRLKDGNGEYRDVEMTAQWSESDQSLFVVSRDVSARRQMERMKMELTAMVSHDIRTPLSSLLLTLELFKTGKCGELNERGSRLIGSAQKSVDALMRLINDFLDSQKYESSGITLVPEHCSSKELVDDSISRVAQAAEAKQIKLVTRIDDVELKVDGEQLARVIVNLLHNAIKFSPNESRIQVFAILLTEQVERGPEMEFLVSDGGPGIPPHMQDKIFQKFTQVGTGSAGERSGSGLGLAICKSIVEAHGGAIGVRSLPGQGSTFWFRIPLQVDTQFGARPLNSMVDKIQP